MKVGIIGIYDPHYARNYVIEEGLRRVGVEIVVVRLNERSRTLGRLWQLVRQFAQVRNCDVILIPAFNQLIAPVIGLLGRLRGKPVLLDYLVGLADVEEGRQKPSGLKFRIFKWVDRFNLSWMTSITDTSAHIRTFSRLLGKEQFPKMHVIPVGARDLLTALPPPHDAGPIVVQYVGTFIPFHGTDIIVQAAHLLRDDPRIQFELIGRGQMYQTCKALADELQLPNIRFIKGYFEPPELLEMVARSTIQLGVFGAAEKTTYVVPNKVYESLFLGRPTITAEAPALNEFFTPGEHVLTVPPGDPQALAQTILHLADSPDERRRLRDAGMMHIQESFLPQHIGVKLRDILREMIETANGDRQPRHKTL